MKKKFYQQLTLTAAIILFLGFSALSQNAWINEFHYDNDGGDVGEFVEVVIENSGTYTLSDFSVVLYNGNGGTSYDTKTLDQFTTTTSSGNFTIFYYNYTDNGGSIQNGSPDGMALVYSGSVISGQFLSYEGSFSAIDGPANGLTSTDIGVSEPGSTLIGYSLQLSGTGSIYGDFTWQSPATETKGTLNNSQVLSSSGVSNPADLLAAAVSPSQVDLSWTRNANLNNVLLAWNNMNTFGTPTGSYSPGDPITGGGTVLYSGSDTTYNHTGLTPATDYFYQAWSYDGSNTYSSGTGASTTTFASEPSGHPSGFSASTNGPTRITVSWTDSGADSYLVKASDTGYSNIPVPVDGTVEADSRLVKNVVTGTGSALFSGLDPATQWYFKIFPYNGSGSAVNYKTDGTVPQATATTDDLQLDLLITEVADPSDSSSAKYIELYNSGTGSINLSDVPIYLARQANGGSYGSVLLEGSVAAGDFILLAYDSVLFVNSYSIQADYYDIVVSGNGNDGYFLFYDGDYDSGFLFDAYGVPDQDGTGQDWEYLNGHSVRKRGITAPNNTFTMSDWVFLGANHDQMTPGAHAETVTWQGASSTDWNERGTNWDGTNGYVPDASYDVTVPGATNSPEVNEGSACNDLDIQTSGSVTIKNGGSLKVVKQ